jgi:hypothetical protein
MLAININMGPTVDDHKATKPLLLVQEGYVICVTFTESEHMTNLLSPDVNE